MVRIAIIASALAFCPSLPVQERPGQIRIDDAVRRGAEALKEWVWRRPGGRETARELILLAMIHAGITEKDPCFAGLFQSMIDEKPETTYRTALRAMVLEEVDRVRYQFKIFECAQFLVDNQCQNGQWSYGAPTTYPSPTPSGRKDAASSPPPGTLVVFADPTGNVKPPVVRTIPVRKQREGPPCGDNSNSQYAALGLRACHDAGIVLPREVVARAAKWWRESQCGDPAAPGGRASTGGGPEPRGWGYRGRLEEPYGSMTAGAVGSLVICDCILGDDWKKDAAVNAGVNWIRDNFSVRENPRRGAAHHLYYLYALERAGILYGTETFGRHAWYPEGAAVLLREQRPDGSWGGVVDTCFAILFLRRATRPLVESRDLKDPR